MIDALGAMTGFVGGNCVEASVREFSLRVLESGEPLLLQVRPGDVGRTELEGAVEVHNPCLSGGSIDVFLEPVIPAARLVVVGETPVAQAIGRIGAELGFEVELVDGEAWRPGSTDAAVVIASHGKGEEPALAAALAAGVPYIGLVASDKRGAAVVASLDVDDSLRDRVHTPAGLKLGGRSPGEIALGVLAEIVQIRATEGAWATDDSGPAPHEHQHAEHHGHEHPADHEHDAPHEYTGEHEASGPATAIDPVCGMTVIAADPTPHTEHDGRTVWFCSGHCKALYLKEPERYAVAV
ncbi:XdhC family protein [Agromyces protaetiae]|uniref:XdhC family protein n=1 Tax=Agromyces protaetiae TaxID=2509455 RepID=UPI001FB74A60|nr:XdhC family protein [Agromyces protaetiae]